MRVRTRAVEINDCVVLRRRGSSILKIEDRASGRARAVGQTVEEEEGEEEQEEEEQQRRRPYAKILDGERGQSKIVRASGRLSSRASERVK